MYQFLVKRHLRKQFDRVSVGDHESVLRGVDDQRPPPLRRPEPAGRGRHTKQACGDRNLLTLRVTR